MTSRYKYPILYWIFAVIYLGLAVGWVYRALESSRIHYWFFAATFALLAVRELRWYFGDKSAKGKEKES